MLAEAIDGGETLDPSQQHPWRTPTYHCPTAVQELADRLALEWARVAGEFGPPDGDWYREEIEKVVAIYGHAAIAGEGVASILPMPSDPGKPVFVPLLDGP
jgi:hypothetical protein